MLRIHASQHKCLTMYYIKVMQKVFNWRPYRQGYTHLESIEGMFYNQVNQFQLISINGFTPDITRLGDDFRLTRFIRDPRDLIVSGYYYHLRGAEPWFRFKGPSEKYWQPINGRVPNGLDASQSYSDFLQSVSIDDGLIAEMQFRANHLASWRQWPEHKNIRLYRYEDILGNEESVFDDMFRFYGFSDFTRHMGRFWANRYKAGNQINNAHLRNPSPGQWRDVFSPKVQGYFDLHYGDLLDRLGYD